MNKLVWVETDDYTYNGKPIPRQIILLDPETGKPPLCECQKALIFDKYNASSGMNANERTRTFFKATIDDENKQAFSQAEKFINYLDGHLKTGSWLYIFGDDIRAKKAGLSAFGTGKSYLTHCIGNELTLLRKKAIYVTEDKLLMDIKDTYRRDSEESEAEVLYRYQNVPILLIDDCFKSKITDWVEDKLFHLFNNRDKPGLVTVVNSNYAPNRIEEQMPKNGKAITSRILGKAILIEMIGKDRRRLRGVK